jgi:hypothetical protein
MDLPPVYLNRTIGDYLLKLRDMHAVILKAVENHLGENQRKRARNGEPIAPAVSVLHEGQFVLLKYPSRPPNKLAGLYRGPMIISSIDRPDLIKVRDLITDKISMVHASRVIPFRHPKTLTEEEARALAAVDMDEFYVREIVEHRGGGTNPKKWEYRVRWLGYEPEDDTWLPYKSVKDLEALDKYAKDKGIDIPE